VVVSVISDTYNLLWAIQFWVKYDKGNQKQIQHDYWHFNNKFVLMNQGNPTILFNSRSVEHTTNNKKIMFSVRKCMKSMNHEKLGHILIDLKS
jgi:hypothetical protein